MKLRIKYTNTQKFAIEVEEPTLGNLKSTVLSYILSTYEKDLESIVLSFNGKDPICGENDSSLASLGIVNGDLLVIIPPDVSTSATQKDSSLPSASTVSQSTIASRPMEKQQKSCENVCVPNFKVSNLLEAIDGKPPDSVFRHFEQYSPSTESEALNLLIHITMVEAGFVLGESPGSSPNLPLGWKEMVSTLKYHHPGFETFVCTVVIVTMGNIKQVLASFTGQESEISVKLETKDYFQSKAILPHRLTRLSNLAKTLRNKLLYPLQVAGHQVLGLPAPWHLAGLPQEILVIIASQLKVKAVLNLSSSCKRLRSGMMDNKLWYNLFKRDFKDQYHSSDTISGADWKAKYQAAFERKKERDKNENRRYVFEDPSPDPLFPQRIPDPRPNPFSPYMPQPRGPDPYYPPLPDYPQPNPYWDPDSPYFGGDIPPPGGPYPLPGGPFPGVPDPLDPFGRRPRRPQNPLQPPFMQPQPRAPRGPRFDFI